MNPSPKTEADAIRENIDVTRQRMDDTMNALGDRLKPRHLLDEALGYFRGHNSDGESRLTHMREKISHSADTAFHAITDTVKKNPMPALLIGAGVAWMIYESRRDRSAGNYERARSPDDLLEQERRYDPDTHYDRPLEYPPSSNPETEWSDQGGSKLGQMKEKLGEKASAARSQLKSSLSHAGETAKEKLGVVRERAGEMTDRVRDTTREAYQRTRVRVTATADEHPLEVGLVALATGLIAGLMLPTPSVVNRRMGPTADRLRARTREAGAEMLEKGKHVAQAAVAAAKDEAQAQGLTPEHLREQGAAVAERAREAARDTARQEGIPAGAGNQSGSMPTDPTAARPAI